MLEDILVGDARTLHVLPSTRATLSAAVGWAAQAEWCVVGLADAFQAAGLVVAGLESPAGFLAACRDRGAERLPLHTVVFTDQFVSAEHAPLRARPGQDEVFFPTLELVAAAQYQFRIACWETGGFRRVDVFPAGNEVDLLRALLAYYQACDALGDAWLMRSRQHQRTLPGRVEAARNRLRYYQSIVMLADVDGAAAHSRLEVLKALVALQQELPRIAAP